jgi:hypothetical protein
MPPPKQKPTAPILPFDSGRAFSQARRDEVLEHLRPVHLAELDGALLVVARVAADRGQPSGAKATKFATAKRARDVFDVRIQAAVLVDDEDRGSLPALAGRAK